MSAWGTTDIASLLRLCDRGIVTGGDADELLSLVERATGCRGAALTHAFTFTCEWRRITNISDDWLATHTRLRDLDPSAEILEGRPFATPYFVQCDTPAPHRGTELHHALPDHGFSDVAIARLYSPFQSDLIIALYRFDGAPAFSEADRWWFRLLLPSLSRGLSSRRALAAFTAARGETLDQALPTLAGHVFLGLPRGDVTWSPRARRLLVSRLGLDSASFSRADATVQAAARLFLSTAEGARSQSFPGGLRLEFALVPPGRGESQRLLGWFVDDSASERGPVPADELLSPRQRVVARAAARGKSVAIIARELRLEPETVRSHLRAIYRKLGVQQRVELARLFG